MSKLENHVFFDSAVNKTHYAYNKILNQFPYDSSEYEFNQYFKNIDGFTRHVYDKLIPKNLGYLEFNGTNEVFVKDFTGNILNDYAKERKYGLIDLNKKKFSFDFWVFIKNENVDNNVQILFQKKDSNSNGLTIFLDSFSSTSNTCNINILITNGNEYHKCTSSIHLNVFQHINCNVISVKGKRFVRFYQNGKKIQTTNLGSISSNSVFNDSFIKSNVYIGNGSNHTCTRDNSVNITRTSGLKGYLDEFRFFTGTRKDDEIFFEKNRSIHARTNLNVYYKFNEPSTSYLNNHIVLDSSGNKVHGLILNHDDNSNLYTQAQISSFRAKVESIPYPINYEDVNFSPVIFLNYGNILSDQNDLLEKAEIYDKVNPNVFYKLFPKYMFVENADLDGLSDIFASKESIQINTDGAYDLLGIKTASNSTLFRMLTIWARFFDQLKCYIDHITKIIDFDYNSLNESKKQASIILPYALSQIGIDFKEIFPSTILEKLDKKNLTKDEVFSDLSIRQIQNNLWKRFLINSQDFIKSKGTVSSLKSVFNSFGLEADTFVNFREYNSQNKLNLHQSFVEKTLNLKFISFGKNSFENKNITYDINSLPENRILIEVSSQDTQDPVKNLIDYSNNWAIEYFFKFEEINKRDSSLVQSLIRIDNEASANDIKPYINLIFKREDKDNKSGSLLLYINETNNNNDIEVIELNDVNLFSGKLFYICINKETKTSNYSVYDLNIVESDFGSKNKAITKSSKVINITNKSVDLDETTVRIGNFNPYIQNTKTSLSNMSFDTNFDGDISCLRIWKTKLSEKDILVHKTDMSTTGLYSKKIKTSQDDLVLNTDLKEKFVQNLTSNNDNFVDNYYTLVNNIIYSNVNAVARCRIYVPQSIVTYKFIKSQDYKTLQQSKNIDYPESYNRVQIASFEDKEFAKDFNNLMPNPSYSTESNFDYYKDVRFSIDFSVSNFINNEISKIVLINDYYTKTLSNSSSLYEENYQNLMELQNNFFERLEKQINIKQMYQVYKYFDNILEDILNSAIPSRVHYHGFNFVYESHIAERNKYVYKMSNSRLPIVDNNLDYSRYDTRYSRTSFWDNSDIRHDVFINDANSLPEESVRRFSR